MLAARCLAGHWLMVAAVLSGLAVAIGAFGAHGLKPYLSEPMQAVYQTGVQYHFVHALGLLLISILMLVAPASDAQRWLQRAAVCMLLGVVLFSGSLYSMAITELRMLGMITPVGGVSWLVGWTCLLMAGKRLTHL